METKEINNTVVNLLEQAKNIKEELYNIVWEEKEGQHTNGEQHFDDLPKAQRVTLIGLLSDAVNLVQSLTVYESWFINK